MNVICVILIAILILENIVFIKLLKRKSDLLKQCYDQKEKFKFFFELSAEWFLGDMSGKSISKVISKKGYKTVAIYGMGTLGELTYSNLYKNQEIYIKYGIDRNSYIKKKTLDIYNFDNELEQVDLIIVTAVTDYEKIKKSINEKIKFDCEIVSLSQLIEEMYI